MDETMVIPLARDLRRAAATLSEAEVRFLVDSYYQMQENRKRSANQERALAESGEPHVVVGWLAEQGAVLERSIKGALDVWGRHNALASWARKTKGIGPVLAAGLAAHIDLSKAPVAGSVWRFAGLDPTQRWEKGKKRPWNASLKTLCWKIGESFVKVSGREGAFYGALWRERKAEEWRRNLAGELADEAARKLSETKIGKSTVSYRYYAGLISPSVVRPYVEAGVTVPELKPTERGDEVSMLPPAHIHARAKRWVVKLFLSHYYQHGRELLGLPVAKPYAIEHLGHVRVIPSPH